jgi:hypothetical protein
MVTASQLIPRHRRAAIGGSGPAAQFPFALTAINAAEWVLGPVLGLRPPAPQHVGGASAAAAAQPMPALLTAADFAEIAQLCRTRPNGGATGAAPQGGGLTLEMVQGLFAAVLLGFESEWSRRAPRSVMEFGEIADDFVRKGLPRVARDWLRGQLSEQRRAPEQGLADAREGPPLTRGLSPSIRAPSRETGDVDAAAAAGVAVGQVNEEQLLAGTFARWVAFADACTLLGASPEAGVATRAEHGGSPVSSPGVGGGGSGGGTAQQWADYAAAATAATLPPSTLPLLPAPEPETEAELPPTPTPPPALGRVEGRRPLDDTNEIGLTTSGGEAPPPTEDVFTAAAGVMVTQVTTRVTTTAAQQQGGVVIGTFADSVGTLDLSSAGDLPQQIEQLHAEWLRLSAEASKMHQANLDEWQALIQQCRGVVGRGSDDDAPGDGVPTPTHTPSNR